MGWIKKLLASIKMYLFSDQAKADIGKALNYAAEALPYLDVAAQVVTKLTPMPGDDIAWALVRKQFPRLFSYDATPEERKLAMMAYASEAVASKFGLTTNQARLAVEAAFAQRKSEW